MPAPSHPHSWKSLGSTAVLGDPLGRARAAIRQNDAAGTLLEAADFVESMLTAYGYDLERVQELGEVADSGEPSDLIEDYSRCARVADQVDMDVESTDSDVVAAMANLRDIYRYALVLPRGGGVRRAPTTSRSSRRS